MYLESNTITQTSNIVDKINNIDFNVAVSTNAILFLVAFIVVLVVCFILYKAIDNCISY